MSNEMTELEEMRELQQPKERSVRGLFSTAGKLDWVQVFLGGILLILVLSVLALGYYLFIDDNPPAEIMNVQLYGEDFQDPVDAVIAMPGDYILYGVDWCKHTNASAEVRRTWVNEIMDIQPVTHPAVVDPGCRTTNLSTKIPDTLRPSTYDLLITLEYEVNPLMTRDVTFRVPEITVLEIE